jgi:hypothetical protein
MCCLLIHECHDMYFKWLISVETHFLIIYCRQLEFDSLEDFINAGETYSMKVQLNVMCLSFEILCGSFDMMSKVA